MTARCSRLIRRGPRMAASPEQWTSPVSAATRCDASLSIGPIASMWRHCARKSRATAQPDENLSWWLDPPGPWMSVRSTIFPRSLCREEALWFHVDGAFGALGVLSPVLAPKLAGIEQADSIALDFHKWGQVPYDAGFLLVRDGERHRDAFAAPAAYLRREARGLAAGSPWPCDLGPDLSRGFRALKTWFTLKTYGAAALGAAIEGTCALAQELAGRIEAEPELELLAPVGLNIVCFRFRD